MAEIVVKITVPESEYKTWSEFQEEGVESCMQSIRQDLSMRLRQDYVKEFQIEVLHYE